MRVTRDCLNLTINLDQEQNLVSILDRLGTTASKNKALKIQVADYESLRLVEATEKRTNVAQSQQGI